jgi:hypothetical protein
MSTNRKTRTYDHALLLHDGAALSASAAGNVATVARILDLGAGLVEGDIIIDVSAMDVNNTDEMITVCAQISDSATFASAIYEACNLRLGYATTLGTASTGCDVDRTTGRFILPFRNEIEGGVQKRYLRLYFMETGTTTTFDCVAWLSKRS